MPNPIVVLDPGHGGRSTAGGSSPNNAHGYNGLLERDLTLELARRIVTAMSKRVPADVRLTRASDVNLPLADRAAVARDANADVFLSLHFNGSDDPAVDGTEAWTASHASARSRRLAQRLCNGVATAARVRNRGIKERDLGVLVPARHARGTAACLLEVAFLSNRAQADRLAQSQYLDELALAVAQGIGDTLAGTDAPTAQAVAFGGPAAQQRLASPPMLADHLLKPDRKSRLPAATPTLAIRWNVDAAAVPAPTQIDLAVHFHGFVAHGSEIDVARKADASGLDLSLRRRPTIGLVPRGWKTGGVTYTARLDANRKPVLDADGKKILDPQADVVDFPALVDNKGKGLADLIAFAHPWLDGEVLHRPAGTSRIDRCIFTAHSGGGARLQRALANGQDPHEIHVFDGFYEAPAAAAAWVAKRIRVDAQLMAQSAPGDWNSVLHARGGACRVVAGGGTLENSRALQAAIDAALGTLPADQRTALRKYYRVEQTIVPHGDIPGKFGGQLLADAAADLTPAVIAVPAQAPAKAHEVPAAALDDRRSTYYACLAAHKGMNTCPAIPPLCIPPRQSGALAGSAVMAKNGVAGEKEPKSGPSWKAREDGICEEIVAGNIPSFLRTLKKVSLKLKDRKGSEHDVDLFVMPDYLAVGSDADFVTVPLDGVTAQRVADAFGCVLPTAKIVWEVHGKADVRLTVRPRPYAAIANKDPGVSKADHAKFDGKDQDSTWAYVEYDREMRDAIRQKLADAGMTRAALVSGYRKDVITTKALEQDASKLCFFGGWLKWTNKQGEKREILQGREGGYPQQGPHHARYADYSHGVRLVSSRVVIDGKDHSIATVMADPVLGPMLAHEAPFNLVSAHYR